MPGRDQHHGHHRGRSAPCSALPALTVRSLRASSRVRPYVLQPPRQGKDLATPGKAAAVERLAPAAFHAPGWGVPSARSYVCFPDSILMACAKPDRCPRGRRQQCPLWPDATAGLTAAITELAPEDWRTVRVGCRALGTRYEVEAIVSTVDGDRAWIPPWEIARCWLHPGHVHTGDWSLDNRALRTDSRGASEPADRVRRTGVGFPAPRGDATVPRVLRRTPLPAAGPVIGWMAARTRVAALRAAAAGTGGFSGYADGAGFRRTRRGREALDLPADPAVVGEADGARLPW
jgi:hypothetical protein